MTESFDNSFDNPIGTDDSDESVEVGDDSARIAIDVDEILRRWQHAIERGDSVSLIDLCDGDARRCRDVRRALDDADDILRRFEASATSQDASRDTSPATARRNTPQESAAAEPESSSATSADRIASYRLILPIGTGGMGDVFLAEDETHRSLVAVKILRRGMPGPDRFEREARILETLDQVAHPNIVPLHDYGEHDGRRFIAMKWLSGPSLDTMRKPVPPPEVARIGLGIARALGAAHEAGILHRDLKPANIILDDGEPHLVDFGLAHLPDATTLTRSGDVFGTPAYMAPEQATGSGLVDERSDIYALGATLYELIAGRRCFTTDIRERLLDDIATKTPPPLALGDAENAAGVGAGTARIRDRDLETIVMRCLEKSPRVRFAHADELGDDLERYLAGRRIRSRRPSHLARLGRRLHRRRRVLIPIVIVVGVVVAAFFMLREKDDATNRLLNRTIDGAMTEARASLDVDDPEGAVRILRPFVDRRPARNDYTELLRESNARAALDRLLDLVLSATEAQSESLLIHLAEDVRRHDALRDEPRLARYALALTHFHLGENDAFRRGLDDYERIVGTDPASRALRRLATGANEIAPNDDAVDNANDANSGNRETTPLPADVHVFTAAARRLAGASLTEVRASIDRALVLDATNRRARSIEATLAYDEDRIDEAFDLYRRLLRRGRRNDAVHRNLALVHVRRGDYDAAEAALDEIAVDDRTPHDIRLRLDLALRRRDATAFDRLFAAAVSQWPEAPAILSMRLHRAQSKGNWNRVAELAETLSTQARRPLYRDHAAVLLARCDYENLLADEAPREEWLDFDDDLDETLAELREPSARAGLLWIRGQAREHTGRDKAALDAYAQAANVDEHHVPSRLAAGVLTYDAVRGTSAPAWLRGHHVARTLADLGRLKEARNPRDPLPPESRSTIFRIGLALAIALKDGKACTDWSQAVRENLSDLEQADPTIVELLERARATDTQDP